MPRKPHRYIYLVGFLCLMASPTQAMQVCGTPVGFAADSTDCLLEDPSHPQQIAKVRLWRARRWTFEHPVLIDSLGATAGSEVCFTQPDSVQATYWLQPVTVDGVGACLGSGVSWPNTVGVGPRDDSVGPGEEERYYDLFGARLRQPPTSPGVYWRRVLENGKWRTRKIVVMVKTP